MTLTNRIESLTEKHNILDKQVKDAYNNKLPTEEISKLKIKKLAIKDELFKVEKELQWKDNTQET